MEVVTAQVVTHLQLLDDRDDEIVNQYVVPKLWFSTLEELQDDIWEFVVKELDFSEMEGAEELDRNHAHFTEMIQPIVVIHVDEVVRQYAASFKNRPIDK